MTLKAKRRVLMKAVGHEDERVKRHSDTTFTYKRSGPLLRVELRKVLEHFDAWKEMYESQHKRALRGHIRSAALDEHEWTEMSDGKKLLRGTEFSEHDLNRLITEARNQ